MPSRNQDEKRDSDEVKIMKRELIENCRNIGDEASRLPRPGKHATLCTASLHFSSSSFSFLRTLSFSSNSPKLGTWNFLTADRSCRCFENKISWRITCCFASKLASVPQHFLVEKFVVVDDQGLLFHRNASRWARSQLKRANAVAQFLDCGSIVLDGRFLRSVVAVAKTSGNFCRQLKTPFLFDRNVVMSDSLLAHRYSSQTTRILLRRVSRCSTYFQLAAPMLYVLHATLVWLARDSLGLRAPLLWTFSCRNVRDTLNHIKQKMFAQDFGHLCCGRRIHTSGNSDLKILSNLGGSSNFTWL